ncbi:MAG: pyridoxal phosphate-dependent aminotransferase family protein [Burkholderiales bacterium]|nr:pyridoxal phosphate-dependent aminotransferase family protein [Bacteroidia bacterium]
MGGFKKNPSTIIDLLQQRRIKGSLRSLLTSYPSIDFSSNDYLGFSSKGLLTEELKTMDASNHVGSTGSRLISGNSLLFQEIENSIAVFHKAEAALVFNSGYDANLGLLSSVPQKGDLILSDELIHASLIDGIRLSFASNYKFKHNDLLSLKELLNRHRNSFNEIYVVVESVYSMDGDCAPLLELAELCRHSKIHLIVDEAHAIGVFGKNGEGLCQELNIQEDCFARIYTYGKAMGCHGAAILGNEKLKQYLINFSRSFIYTTAMPEHSLLAIKAAYQLLLKTTEIKKLKSNIDYFNSKVNSSSDFIESKSAIHCQLVPGNHSVQLLEEEACKADIFIKGIKSPTIKEGQERIRICLHSFNTESEIDLLVNLL